MSLRSLLVLALASLAVPASAQVSGTVRDGDTDEPLIGATVSTAVDGRLLGAATDLDGAFQFDLPDGEHTLTVRFVGYRTDSLLVTAPSSDIEIGLEPDTEAIGEIVVQGDEIDRVDDVEMGVSRIDAADIQRLPLVLGEADPVRALQLLPGVSQGSESSSGFFVRGGGADQNLVLLDGTPLHNPSHVFGFFSVFNPDVVSSATLYKGGLPSRYGGRLSSVLEVDQRTGETDRVRGRGGIGLLSSRGVLDGPLPGGAGTFLVGARRSYADAFLALSPDSSLNQNIAYFYDLNGRTDLRLNDRNRITLSGYSGRDRLRIGDTFGTRWGNTAGSARWTRTTDRLATSVGVSTSDYTFTLEVLEETQTFDWTSNIRSDQFEASAIYDIDPGGSRSPIEVGFVGTQYSVNPGTVDPGEGGFLLPLQLSEQTGTEAAVFFGGERAVTDRLSIRLGNRLSGFVRTGPSTVYLYEDDAPVVYDALTGRYEPGTVVDSTTYNSGDRIASFGGLEPRVAVRYRLADRTSLKLGFERTRQNLQLVTNSTSPTPLDVWELAGEYVEAQTANQIAIGGAHRFGSGTGAVELSVEAYARSLDGLVDYVDGADLTLNDRLETELLPGEGRAYGVEMLLEKTAGRFSGFGSYTWSRSERRVAGLGLGDPGINNGEWYPAPQDRPHNLSLTGVYQLSPRLSLSGNFVLTSGSPTTYPVARYTYEGAVVAEYGERNAARLPLYHRLDVAAAWQVGRGELVMSVYNLYNRKNASSVTFRQSEVDPLQTEAIRTSIFGIVPGIAYNLSF
ncbi:MAG: carboxypeptidase-like regulatory domain-containing protein [Bacteroidota bacterium]